MKNNFPASLKAVLVHEGGYVNDPKDPGGATNKGVTQSVYDDYRRKAGQSSQSVRAISQSEIGDIYRNMYWDKVMADGLPSGVDYAVFDFAVNSGVNRASRYLQATVGAAQDGVVGPATLRAVGCGKADAIINTLCDKRLAFLKQLSTFSHFGKGWTARVKDVRQRALLAGGYA